MKKIFCGLLTLASLNSLSSFAFEGCEITARSGNTSTRGNPIIKKHYSLEKCAKELALAVTEGGWNVGVAEHVNENVEVTFLKFERITRDEFFKVRNNH